MYNNKLLLRELNPLDYRFLAWDMYIKYVAELNQFVSAQPSPNLGHWCDKTHVFAAVGVFSWGIRAKHTVSFRLAFPLTRISIRTDEHVRKIRKPAFNNKHVCENGTN